VVRLGDGHFGHRTLLALLGSASSEGRVAGFDDAHEVSAIAPDGAARTGLRLPLIAT
jgi:hypothetical protein